MRKYLLPAFSCLILFVCQTAAQKPEKSPVKFGKVSAADFNTNLYRIDSNAHAVVVADIGYSSFIANNKGWFSLEFTRYARIHILNKNAYDEANISVPLFSNDGLEEALENLKAFTYNLENGKVIETKLEKNAVFKDKIDKNWIVKKFTLPNLKEGCIIEFEYKVKSDFLRNLQPWAFQDKYPVLWSEYEVGIPEFFSYIFLSQGYQGFYIRDSKDRRESFAGSDSRGAEAAERYSFQAGVTDYRWVMKDVPALKEEAFTSTMRNHIAKIEFQLSEYRYPLTPRTIMGTWKELNDELMKSEYFGLPVNRDNGFLNDEIPVLAKLEKNETKKAKLIYEHVRDHFTCTDHTAVYMDQTLRNLVKTKNGTVSEINLLLVAMLKNAGLHAEPVIAGLRSRGVTYSLYPILSRFNYVLAELTVGGRKIYLDASEPMLGFGKLDPLCYNGHARVLNGGPEAIEFNPDSLLERKVTSVFIINDDKGNLTGSMQQTPGYYESAGLREKIKDKGKNNLTEEIKKDFNAEIEIENFRIDSLDKKDEPISINYDFNLKTDKEDIIYLNPMFGEGFQNNPFKSAERFYPVEMPYTKDETYILSMDVPQGYVVDELPKSMVLKLNDYDEGLFEYRVSESNGTISLRCRLRIKRTLFAPDEYDMLREFFNMLVAKQTEQIVFKKKK
jgi:hypothetical protein